MFRRLCFRPDVIVDKSLGNLLEITSKSRPERRLRSVNGLGMSSSVIRACSDDRFGFKMLGGGYEVWFETQIRV